MMITKKLCMAVLMAGVAFAAYAQTPPTPTPVSPAPSAAPATAPAAAPAAGQQRLRTAVIGTVDMQELFRTSNAGKSLNQQAEQRQKALQAEFTKQQQALRTQQQQILSQRASLTPEDLKKKETELQALAKKAQDDLDKKKAAFETSYGKARKQIFDQLAKILPNLAAQRGMTIVLNKADIVVSDQEADLTAEALKQLNAALPSVKM